MKWFVAIPLIFISISAIVSGIKLLIFIPIIDYQNPNKTNDNLEKTASFIADNIVPTEFKWMSWVVSKITNPWILLILILGILWLFGYFLPRG